MKANEFLNEGIIDKLKGAFKKSPRRTTWNEPTDTLPQNYDYETPAYQRKQAYLDKQAQATAPASSLPKMKVKKTDPRTAIGGKKAGGSPEFKAARTQIQPPAPEVPVAKKPARQRDPVTGKFMGKAPTAVKPVQQTSTSVAGIDQDMLAKAVLGSLKQITDPDLIRGIRAYLNTKVSK